MKPIRIQSFTIFNSIKTVQNKDLYAFGSLQITLSFQLKILQFVSTQQLRWDCVRGDSTKYVLCTQKFFPII